MSEQTTQSKETNHRKQKIKPLPVIIIAVIMVLLVIAIGAAVVLNSTKNNEDDQVQVNLNQTNLKPQNVTTQVSNVVTTIEILFENSAIPVGTTLQVTALVSPEDTEHALTWNSSNQSVFTVTQDGVVTITGTGTAALTATIGTVSDAVAIEGVATVTTASINNYPVYTGGSAVAGVSGNSASGTTEEHTGNGNAASDGGSSDGDESDGSWSDGGSSDSGSSDSGTGGTDTGSAGNSGTTDSSNNGGSTGNTGASGSGAGASSTDIGEILPSYGFAQTMSNVYVCQENDIYYGEIVTQPNVTICYIKQRSSAFDSKIISVISQLLPSEYQSVWNNYISAATDRTFTAEGRRVRIVAAAGGGHSQIVIYN